MKHIGLAILIYVAALLESSAALANDASQSCPALLTLVALLAASGHGEVSAVIWAAVSGLVSDCLHTGPLGIEMLTTTLMVAVLVVGNSQSARRATLTNGLRWCCAIFAACALAEFLRTIAAREEPDLYVVGQLVVLRAGVTMLLLGCLLALICIVRMFRDSPVRTRASIR